MSKKQVDIIQSEKAASNIIDDLAMLPAVEYDKLRKKASARLGIRVTTLDDEIKKRQATTNIDNTTITTEVEPWPDPVDGEELFNLIYINLSTHIILPPGAAVSITLWVVLTYCFDAFLILPILALLSPEKRCGKTTLLLLLNGLVNNGRLSSNISPAAVYRVVEKYKPTLLTDEADTFFKNNEELRGIYNSGHTREAAFIDRVNKETMEVERFSTWSPKAIAMIGKPKDTILDRSIVVTMSRKKKGEIVQKKKLTHYNDSTILRQKAKRWALDNMVTLKKVAVDVPDLGNDRMTDNWTPLFAIAAAVGDDIPEKTREAMLLLSGIHNDDESIGSMLLEDIQTIFNEIKTDRISSEDLVNRLVVIDDRPWPEWNKGKPMSKPGLARQLKKFGLKSKTIRIGNGTIKGYKVDQFNDAFIRYIPTTPILNVTPSQVNNINELSNFESVTQENNVTAKKADNCPKSLECYNVTDRIPPPGREGIKNEVEI